MKTIHTIDKRPYVATVTTAATVTDKASGLVLAKASEAGQITFLAIGEETIISDDAAVVAPSPFSGASAGSSAGRGVGEERIEEMIGSALSTEEPESHATPTGTDNAIFYWAEIADANVPAGQLHEIAIQCRSTETSAMTTEPRYLGLWEATEAGGWARVGASLNAVVQAVGVGSVWSFEGVTLAGRTLRLCLLPDRESGWPPNNQVFGARVSAATDGSNITFTSGQSAFLPEMRIAVTRHISLFAPAAHVEDMVAHITAAERTAWNGKADASALATKVNSSTFTSHVNDAVKHVTAAERTAWNAATALPSLSIAFAGDNTHAGVETFNGPVVLNAGALSSTTDVSPDSLTTMDAATIASFVLALDSSRGLYPPDNRSDHNAAAYTASSLKAPSSAGVLAHISTSYTQDDQHTYYHFCVSYGRGAALFFGGGGTCPDGQWQEARPYMLSNAGNNWLLSYFCVAGSLYHHNEHPYLLLYDKVTQDVVYAEILDKAGSFKTFSVHQRGLRAGDRLDETIYSGIARYAYASMPSYLERTEVTTYGSTKRSRVAGAVVAASGAGLGREVNVRTYVPPMIDNYDAGLADKYATATHAQLRRRARARSLEVAYATGEALPASVRVPATGESLELSVSAHASGADRSHGRVYVQPLDAWVSSSLGADYVEVNSTGQVSVLVAANETTEERKSWLLMGQLNGPAVVLKIVQEANS